jgi:DNA polymerase-1
MKLPEFLTKPDPLLFLTNNYLVLDFETTNKGFGDFTRQDNSIVHVVARSGRTGETYRHRGNEYEMAGLLSLIEQHDFIVAQNAKFELGWLQRCGLDLTKVISYDTMLGKYIQDGNRFARRDLNTLALVYGLGKQKLSIVSKLIDLGVPTETIPPSWLDKYCEQDVVLTEQVFLKQRQQLYEQGLLPVMYTRCLWTSALTDIESNGMQLDPERVYAVYRKFEREYLQLKKRFDDFTGGINQNSPKQVGEYLYDVLKFKELKDFRGEPKRTDAGNRLTGEDTILDLKATNKRQRDFLDLYLKVTKTGNKLTKYLSKLVQCCEEDGGLLYANFNMAVAKTHRLSSSGKKYKIQFQNMDRELKPLFKARYPGWDVGEADEGQLEFRVAVYLGQDKQGMYDIEHDVDVHVLTAAILNDVTEEWMEANKKTDPKAMEWRQHAKPDTFKPLYGGQSGTEKQMEYYAAFREKYADVTAAQNSWVETVLKTKELTLPTGFKFYWPDTKVTRSGYITNTTNICNYPVQHFATAEIVPIAVLHLWHRMKIAEMQSFLVNTVHDSAVAEVHPDEKDMFSELSQTAMTTDVYDYLKACYNIDLNVPLIAEVEIGEHWAEKKGWTDKYLEAA